MGQPNYINGFDLTLHEQALETPLRWKKPQTIFVNSMSDLFHKDVPIEFILRVFEVMTKATWHRFQILTKRSDRLLEVNPHLPWRPHIWMGVSVENDDYTFRIDHLRETGAHIKFLSLEPLLSPLPSTEQVAERLGVSPRQVQILAKSGRLPASRFGRALMIKEADLALVADRKRGRPPKERAKSKAGKSSKRSRKTKAQKANARGE